MISCSFTDQPQFRFRQVNKHDSEYLFDLRNHLSVLKYNQHPVTAKEHKEWFKKQLKENPYFYLVIHPIDDLPVGMVRFDQNKYRSTTYDLGCQISIIIDPFFQGEKIASKIIEQATNHLWRTSNIDYVLAAIRVNNKTSIKAFEKAGYHYHNVFLKSANFTHRIKYRK